MHLVYVDHILIQASMCDRQQMHHNTTISIVYARKPGIRKNGKLKHKALMAIKLQALCIYMYLFTVPSSPS